MSIVKSVADSTMERPDNLTDLIPKVMSKEFRTVIKLSTEACRGHRGNIKIRKETRGLSMQDLVREKINNHQNNLPLLA